VANLRVKGYLVNNSVFPDYEIGAQDLIDKFIGDDTGAPLADAVFTLQTDDGYEVTIVADAGSQRRGRECAASFRATVEPKASSEERSTPRER
jgi:hypothetical protein